MDTSLHLGEMTYEEAVAFMTDKAALPDPVWPDSPSVEGIRNLRRS